MQIAPTKASSGLSFLPNNGEMSRLIRNHDWLQTSLGDPDTWPQSLKTTLSILVNSKFPTVLFWGPDLVCFYNDAFRPSLGIEGKHPWSLGKKGEEMWSDIWPIIKPWLDQVLGGGESIWMENQLVPFYRNGRIEDIYWTFCYNAVFDESNQPAGVLVTCTETTQIVMGEKKLRASELLGRSIIMNSEAAQAVWSAPDFVFEIANEKMLQYIGKDAVIGKPIMEVLPELADTDLLDRLNKVLKTGETFHQSEKRFLYKKNGDSAERYFNYSYKALQNADGENYAILCTSVDITELVVSRKLLEESERNFRKLVMQAPVGICIVREGTLQVEMVNDVFLELVGRTREQMTANSYWNVVTEVASHYSPILQNVFDTGVSYVGTEHRVLLKRKGKEEVVYVNFVYEPIRADNNAIERVMMLAIDVTAQVVSRMEIEAAQAKERLAISVSQLGVFEVDLITNKIISSPRLDEIFGVDHTTDRSRFVEMIHPDDLERRQQAYQLAYETGSLRYEGRIINRSGKVRWMRSWGTILFNEAQVPQKMVGVTQDITEQKEFEEELNKKVKERTLALQEKCVELELSNQKLEEFAHAASHDLKEPMRKIHFFIDRLKNQLGERMKEGESLTFARIENSVKRMVRLIDDMLQYSHVNNIPLETEEVDLNKKLQIVLEDLEVHINLKHAIIEIGPLPVVKGYRRQLQQLFQNLISNSLKYSKPNIPPHITVFAKQVKAADYPKLLSEHDAQQYHLIEVADEGIGFESSHSDEIFRLFYRLYQKDEYGGTGIGLAIARKVMENHGGKIIAEGQPGEGATFKLFFPIHS